MVPIIVTLLLLTGVLFFFLETITPHGVLGFIGGACILGAVVLTYMEYDAAAGTIVLVVSIIAVVAALIVGFRIMPHTSLGRLFILTKNQEKEDGFSAASDELSEDLIGVEGVADSYLRPVGIAAFGNRRVDVIADGEYIPKGSRIRVVEVRANRVVVKRV